MDSDQDLFEKLVEQLKAQTPLKSETNVGDIVIMLRQTPEGPPAAAYARVLGFERDQAKRDEWWHVSFLFLELPPQSRTIILQTPHFTGQEIFTMGGLKVFIQALDFSAFSPDSGRSPKTPEPQDGPRRGAPPSLTLVK